MAAIVLGIPDPWIWMAYLLCLAAALLCVVSGVVRGRQVEEPPSPVDAAWAEREKQVEEED